MRRAWYGYLLLAVVSAGCQSTPAPPPYPADPLCLGKKPSDKATPTPRPVLLAAVADPRPPALPAIVVAEEQTRPVPSKLASGGKRGKVIALPAVRTKEADPPRVTCDAAPDRAWLQGVLERHHHGHFYLRYGKPSLDERWAGKVRLQDDPRLANLRDGDGVRVTGAMVPPLEVKPDDEYDDYPLYRIREVRRVEEMASAPAAD
ncbi:MAG: hypothetical protein JNM56_14290 [Planctomycetia bacterium]|nr:hypothetical protein [Planctomycetia bacterium]